MHERSGNKGWMCKCAAWHVRNMCAGTHTNSWSWVITRECCMVHQYSIRQTSWIFISLFTLPEWQTRQKPFHWDMSLAQSNTLWHRHGHTRWFTYTDKSLRQAVKGAHILTHTEDFIKKKKITWHTDGIDNNFAFLTRKQTHPPPSLYMTAVKLFPNFVSLTFPGLKLKPLKVRLDNQLSCLCCFISTAERYFLSFFSCCFSNWSNLSVPQYPAVIRELCENCL